MLKFLEFGTGNRHLVGYNNDQILIMDLHADNNLMKKISISDKL